MSLSVLGQIRWGTGNENVLDLSHPRLLDAPRTWRRPAPGSAVVRNAAGITDSWVTGRDFLLAGRLRWFRRQDWGGPVGLQAFLDWAGAGNAFRFLPDPALQDFFVDGCYLDEPAGDAAPAREEADGSQSIDVVIRHQTADFSALLRGVMFEYAPGMSLVDPMVAVFSRGSPGTRRQLISDAFGHAVAETSGVLRDRHYEGTLRTTLLEAGRTQLIANPENLAVWGNSNVNLVGDPGGATGIRDPYETGAAWIATATVNTNASDAVNTPTPFTTDGTKSLAVFVRHSTAAVSGVGVLSNTTGTWRHLLRITWSGNTPTVTTEVGSGVIFPPTPYGIDYWLIRFTADNIVAAEDNRIFLFPDRTPSSLLATIFFGANAWDSPTPFISQRATNLIQQQDALSWSWPWSMQPMFVLVEFVERGSSLMSIVGVLGIHSPGEAVPALGIRAGTTLGGYRADHWEVGVQVGTTISSPPLGSQVALLLILYPNGSTELVFSVDGGAEVRGGASSALAFGRGYSTPTSLYLNSRGTLAGSTGVNAFSRVRIGPYAFLGGVRDTIAKARAV